MKEEIKEAAGPFKICTGHSSGSEATLPAMGQVYNHLSREGKKYGYLVNAPRSWLTVKSDILAVEAKKVLGDEVNITTKGQRHLGIVLDIKSSKVNVVGKWYLDG